MDHCYQKRCSFSLRVSTICRQHSDTKRHLQMCVWALTENRKISENSYWENQFNSQNYISHYSKLLPVSEWVELGEMSKQGKKNHRSLMNLIPAKNALILVIRNIIKPNKIDYHQRNLIFLKICRLQRSLLMIYKNCIIM